MYSFAITVGELRYKIDLVKFAYSVERVPLLSGKYLDDVFHQDSIVLSKRWDRDVLIEFYFYLVVVCEFPEEFEPAVCGEVAKVSIVPGQEVPF